MGTNKQVIPRISVIIPTYNRAEALRRCLESLTRQTFKNFEVLICDDGSTDHTFSVVKEFSKYLEIVYDYDSNFGGPARPRNRGIKLARSEYLAFLDSDDWWVPEKLERSLLLLDSGEDVVFHDLFIVNSLNKTRFNKRVKSTQTKKNVYSGLLCEGNVLPNSSVVVRAKIMRQIDGFCEDKELIAAEDFDAWLRIAQKTNRFKRITGCLGYYWTGDDNLARITLKQISRYKTVYQRHLNNLDYKQRGRAIAMLSYQLGRTYQLCDDWIKAVPLLKQSLFGNASFVLRLKSLFLLLGWFVRKIAATIAAFK